MRPVRGGGSAPRLGAPEPAPASQAVKGAHGLENTLKISTF